MYQLIVMVGFLDYYVEATTAFSFSAQDYAAYHRALEAHLADGDMYYGTFPAGFTWASATSSHQIEGAWDADGNINFQARRIDSFTDIILASRQD